MAFAGGSGTLTDPYLITSAAQLSDIRNDQAAHYRLVADIALSGNWTPIPSFTGSLDGNGYTISELQTATLSAAVGLFAGLAGVVRNLSIKTSAVGINGDAGFYKGVLAGTLTATARLEQVVVSGIVNTGGGRAGGLIGYVPPSMLSPMIECGVFVKVQGATDGRVGAIAGYVDTSWSAARSYYSTEVAGMGMTGSGTIAGTPGNLSAAAVSAQGSYSSWSFGRVWEMRSGYPSVVRPPDSAANSYQLPPTSSQTKVDCRVTIDGSPASRAVVAVTSAPVVVNTPAGAKSMPVVVGYGVTDASGNLALDLAGYVGEVQLLAVDNWGSVWQPSETYQIGNIRRPTVFAGVVYECTVPGVGDASEPTWWPYDGGEATGPVGTAVFKARPFSQPLAHGPRVPTVIP
ncbi:hypothetical protein OSS47_00405 [Pseudomonas citronellolis]|uniref:hypothetical protein n=1 Tax=Pseudomonas citronellolis TaxID=53408 RepID=UPI002270DCA3|nr:hypothetical protein [Pseudomonas citronellolis]WAB92476.1 hypothetical protein OSS47_00405 [Pseudomonas citronellolis]